MTHATVFADISASRAGAVPLARLLATIEAGKPHRDSKADCPLFSAFAFGDKRTAKGCCARPTTRCTPAPLSPSTTPARSRPSSPATSWPRSAFAPHYTRRHRTRLRRRAGASSPRLARRLDKAEYPHMVARLNGYSAARSRPNPLPSRKRFYFGRVNGRDFAAYHTEGAHVDELEELDGAALYPDGGTSGDAAATRTAPRTATTATRSAPAPMACSGRCWRSPRAGLPAAWQPMTLPPRSRRCSTHANGKSASPPLAQAARFDCPNCVRDGHARNSPTGASAAPRNTSQAGRIETQGDAAGADEATHQPDEENAHGVDLAPRLPTPRDFWKVRIARGAAARHRRRAARRARRIVLAGRHARGHDRGMIARRHPAPRCRRASRNLAHRPASDGGTWTRGLSAYGWRLIGESGRGKSPTMQFAAAR